MLIQNLPCPQCATVVMVDQRLFDVGTVRLRCPSCEHYFLPSGSPCTNTAESAANAGVPIEIWEPPGINAPGRA